MVGLAVELQQSPQARRAARVEDSARRVEHVGGQRAAPPFRHENQIVSERKNTVGGAVESLRRHRRTIMLFRMVEARSISYRLYPGKRQRRLLETKHGLLKDLWNAALAERVDAWRKCGVRIRLSDQEKALKEIRPAIAGWRGLVHTHEAQTVLKRLDRAFDGFFRRLKAGQAPGFPRFKSADRFPGWGYKEHGNGFRFTFDPPKDGEREAQRLGHGRVTLAGVGTMRARGRARACHWGRVLKADVLRDAFGWRLNLVVEADARRGEATGPAVGLDWGVACFAALAAEDGSFQRIDNPRLLAAEGDEIRAAQRALSTLSRARRISKAALKRRRKALARRHARVAARRKDFLHQTTTALARRHSAFFVEDLQIRNMTATARGTVDEPGSRVAQKAGLNRAILDTAPATFFNLLRTKAAEAGSEFLQANLRRLKPSQRCPRCDAVAAKDLSVRRHDCACGCSMDRDEASALVLLRWGLAERARRAEASLGPADSHPAGSAGVGTRACAA